MMSLPTNYVDIEIGGLCLKRYHINTLKYILSYLRKWESAKEAHITWGNNSLGYVEGVHQG